ncbi:threonine ammonia-lyase [Hyperthermus butylicus]|uniref:threonine ammonia-lyase n=1 Tax=Hyperthermus butylicus (strain DSM 5456 / JCM 9403 / PLM1-5) TaxID=415426 RepID=A2BJC7_HYPBU|nr:threonine ammonia-lyase [Hyperthermus butylicus]ABM80088.1 Threonine dehydratase catabolic [Hyperthermus butylicus DSM 5456]
MAEAVPSDTRELVRLVYEESLKAREIVSQYAHHTPLDPSATFSRLTRARVYLKYENLQKTGSFKIRGALYKIYSIKNEARGVVAASAGNHAQGVAYAASVFGLPAVIVMPETASIAKVEATKGYGAEVVLYGRVFDDAEAKALEIARERGYTFIPAFDDVKIIAGQGTIAHELIQDLGDFDAVVVPVGGGGLISGIASVLKTVKPGIKVYGVEPENAPKFTKSLEAGRPVRVEIRPTIADGLAVKRPGDITFRIVRELVDDIVTVSEEEIAHAIYMLLERGKVLAEGAGAAALAALLTGKLPVEGRKVVAIVSGGNIDLTALYRVLIRGLAASGRIVTLEGYVPDIPGTLADVAAVIARHRGNILEVVHDRSDLGAPAWHTRLRVTLEVPGPAEAEALLNELAERGYRLRLKGQKPEAP